MEKFQPQNQTKQPIQEIQSESLPMIMRSEVKNIHKS